MGETTHLAERVSTVSYGDVPDEAVEHAKRSIRNIVGTGLHGSTHPDGEGVRSYLDAVDATGDAVVIGGGSADAVRAAFANGTFGHVMDYDDTFESVVIHPSCTAFPAALAAAEQVDGSGKDVLTGFVLGLDAHLRIGRSVAPSHWHRGWHSTATIGVFGATAAAASVLGLDAAETRYAFGLAGSFSSGLKKNIGTAGNPIHCGHAAGKGVEAAMLARGGAEVDDAIFQGEYGFGRLATGDDSYDPSEITDPAVEWAVLDNAFKPYPSGVVTHSAMEALRSILVEEDLGVDDVERITATVDELVMDTVDEHDPKDATAAGVSYEFCLAAILRERDVGLSEFTDEYVRAPATQAAMDKVHLDPQSDPFDTDNDDASYGARIAVETVEGETFEAEILSAPGGPSNPLPEERWRDKFFETAGAVLDRSAAEDLETAIMQLETEGALGEMTAGMQAE
jgi:2-methylcitrate dehydratase PrpD